MVNVILLALHLQLCLVPYPLLLPNQVLLKTDIPTEYSYIGCSKFEDTFMHLCNQCYCIHLIEPVNLYRYNCKLCSEKPTFHFTPVSL